MDLGEAIVAAKQAAITEIEKFGVPNINQFDIANEQGQVLSTQFSADPQIVMLGTILMDFKIGQAIAEGHIKDHIVMSEKAARELLTPLVPQEILDKVSDCILGHHKTNPWHSLEAEVVANADCYRFLTPRGIASFLIQVGKREMSLDENMKYTSSKVEEKWNILSLPSCKTELQSNYNLLKQYFSS